MVRSTGLISKLGVTCVDMKWTLEATMLSPVVVVHFKEV
jgi:hypothetical protein